MYKILTNLFKLYYHKILRVIHFMSNIISTKDGSASM